MTCDRPIPDKSYLSRAVEISIHIGLVALLVAAAGVGLGVSTALVQPMARTVGITISGAKTLAPWVGVVNWLSYARWTRGVVAALTISNRFFKRHGSTPVQTGYNSAFMGKSVPRSE